MTMVLGYTLDQLADIVNQHEALADLKKTAAFQLTLKVAEYERLTRQMAQLDNQRAALSQEILKLERAAADWQERAVAQAA